LVSLSLIRDPPLEGWRLISLIAFEKEHGQLPPYNKQRALDLLSRDGGNDD
jgi:hypothetical protein